MRNLVAAGIVASRLPSVACIPGSKTLAEAIGAILFVGVETGDWLARVRDPTLALLDPESYRGAFTTTAGAEFDLFVPFIPRSTPMGDQTPP
jgi:hypothetical protein